ncbi:DUF2306 domain-containing protein [uncultured Tateyamaria sp.]|uniref:DUF2306 domain-containing protein n=1 Tax=uncultured Tateyamaria sp. TaxID=455651 RepID=UPI0026184460|nr:DUF2306 domain-containing protein [uncultured Tateyamaria sp.]
MTLLPLLDASPIVQLHVGAACLALLLGPFALYGRRKGRGHKVQGYVWVIAMAVTALSSFGIHSFAVIGPFSPIHLLSLFALWSLYEGMRHILARRVAMHQIVMRSLYWRGLCVAGLFNFLPGRTTNRMIFPEMPDAGYVVISLGIAGLVWAGVRSRRTLQAAMA